MKNRHAIIETLNEAVRIEHALLMQSDHQATVVRGLWRLQMAPFFSQLAEEARGHARKFGQKIVALGGTPTVEVGPVRQSETVEEMLYDALRLEREALASYERALELADDDTAMRNMLEDHIEAERRHVEELELLIPSASGTRIESTPAVRQAS